MLNESRTPPFQLDDQAVNEETRLRYRYVDLRRVPHAREPAAQKRGDPHRPGLPRFARIPRRRDPDADQGDPGGRPRLPRPEPHAAGALLRPPAVPPALQAAPHDVGGGALLPDRSLLPGRGPARRPPARVHPDRHRDLVPGDGSVPRPHRRHGARPLRPRGGRRSARAAAPPHLARGGGALRHRPARPSHRARARGGRGPRARLAVQGVRGAGPQPEGPGRGAAGTRRRGRSRARGSTATRSSSASTARRGSPGSGERREGGPRRPPVPHRQVPGRCGGRRHRGKDRGRGRGPHLLRSGRRPGGERLARRAPGPDRPGPGPGRGGVAGAVGSRVPDVRMGRARETVDAAPPPVHPRR